MKPLVRFKCETGQELAIHPGVVICLASKPKKSPLDADMTMVFLEGKLGWTVYGDVEDVAYRLYHDGRSMEEESRLVGSM